MCVALWKLIQLCVNNLNVNKFIFHSHFFAFFDLLIGRLGKLLLSLCQFDILSFFYTHNIHSLTFENYLVIA